MNSSSIDKISINKCTESTSNGKAGAKMKYKPGAKGEVERINILKDDEKYKADDNNESNIADVSFAVEPIKSKSDQIKKDILERYQQRQSKQLYIRFPHKIPETQESLLEKVKELTPLVMNVHKPRQRHVRFCLADFATKEDRDIALNNLKKSIKKGDLKKYVVSKPRTENLDFVNELAKRKIQSLEKKKAKQRLKRASKKSVKENMFTSTIVVLNLPKNVSVLEMQKLFSNAVDINIKPCKDKLNKSIAAITFPSTVAASNAIKKKVYMGGNQLIMKFDNKMKKSCRPINNNNLKSIESSNDLAKEKLKPRRESEN